MSLISNISNFVHLLLFYSFVVLAHDLVQTQ